jgi:hypothetical protein
MRVRIRDIQLHLSVRDNGAQRWGTGREDLRPCHARLYQFHHRCVWSLERASTFQSSPGQACDHYPVPTLPLALPACFPTGGDLRIESFDTPLQLLLDIECYRNLLRRGEVQEKT